MAEPLIDKVTVPRSVERPPRTSELVATSIRAQIARGELVPGDRFPSEDELMSVFGIARTTLREALRILESEGLVEVMRGRRGGPRVTRPSVDHLARALAMTLQLDGVSVADVYDARSLVEPELARLFAERHDEAAIEALGRAIDRAAKAVDANDRRAFADAATVIHETIFEGSGNSTLSVFAKLLHELVARFYERAGGAADLQQLQRAVRSYRKFRRLVEAGDAEGAEAHWRRQMAYTKRSATNDPLDIF